MSRFFRFGLSALVLLCAPALFLQGQANTGNPNSPAYGLNGYNLADLAVGSLQIEQGDTGAVSMNVSEQGLALARRAFAAEPLATDALFVLALNERAQGNSGRMQAILDRAGALDKRSRNLGALQLEQAAQSGDLTKTFGIVDRLATVHSALTGEFVLPLVAALDDPRSVPVLRDALAEEPVWAEGFWRSVPRDEVRLSRMFELRQQIDLGTSAQSDADLLEGLVSLGLYSDAFTFWEQVAGEAQEPTAYVASEAYPPFGWQLTSSGERSMTARGSVGYDVYVQNETSGEIARQLVRLSAGSYSFTAAVVPASVAGNISARIQCATSDAVAGDTRTLEEGAQWNISGGCDAYWLIVSGSAWDQRDPLRLTISDMQFQAER